jgi:outer membrane protein assembly factor BamB
MQGPTEFDIPSALPFPTGVLISRNNYLGFFSHDLQQELWSYETPGAMGCLGLAAGPAQTILHKPKTSVVTQYEIKSGKIKRLVETHAQADLVDSSEHGFLLQSTEEDTLLAFDWSGKNIWKWKYKGYCAFLASPGQLSTPHHYVVVETGTKLHVFDAVSGKDLWQFEGEKTGDKGPQDRSNFLTPAFPSVVAMDRQLMTTLNDGRIFKRDLSTGELIKAGQIPFHGAYQVSPQSLFVLNHSSGQFTEYDHVSMKEVKREDLTKQLQELFQGLAPHINALLVMEESILWTTMYGTLMGVERHAGQGKKRVGWRDPLGKNVLMPIGVPPKAHVVYMYYSAVSMKPGAARGLVCYESAG